MSDVEAVVVLLANQDEPIVYPENERMDAFCLLCEDNGHSSFTERDVTGANFRHAMDCAWALARGLVLSGELGP